MTTLDWASVGNRKYEAGVDRGVLYVGNSPGVVWPGLIEIDESPDGGQITPYYIDGVKYLQAESSADFKGTIQAFYSPVEFDVCEGIKTSFGMQITHQRKEPFGLAYRTKIGNDRKGLDFGYKIHLVYNALIDTPSKNHTTVSNSLEPENLSWSFSTKPIQVPGFKPTAHYIFNSTQTPGDLLDEIERTLYGTEDSDPRMPSYLELLGYTTFVALADGGSSDSMDYSRIFDGGGPTSEYPFVDGGAP